MPLPRPEGTRCPWLVAAFLALGVAAAPRPLHAAPDGYIPVRDPLMEELRILDLLDPDSIATRIRLPHLHTQPVQWIELQGSSPPVFDVLGPGIVSLVHVERALARNAGPDFVLHPYFHSTPFTFRAEVDHDLAELSLGIEGMGAMTRDDRSFSSGSGARGRFALSFDHWLAYSDILVGQVDSARTFADPIVLNTDLIATTEDTWLAYTGAGAKWGVQFGRSRWHWGPGDEASLTLSRTSAAFTALMVRARLAAIRADGFILNGTLDAAKGEQLAAHRLEWQPQSRLRIGITETARYHATGWLPLYAVGIIPYVIVQRLETQDNPDSLGAVRNNVMFAMDAAWRVTTGTRVYGEVLIDDLHARTAEVPNKYAWQIGWEGVGMIGETRLSWGGEWTRLTRYVYTSFFGESYEAQGVPLGFPTGPDARRVTLRGAMDLGRDWQLRARVASTDKGENTIDQPFTPGSSSTDAASFQGVVERTRSGELGMRWWPASGVDVTVWGGYTWVDDAGHVPGANRESPTGILEMRLYR